MKFLPIAAPAPEATKRKRKSKPKPPNGAVLYAGASTLDGAPIVVIVTGIRSSSTNAKTGKMLQVWILRADREPHDAVRDGSDVSICGDCPHAGTSCYVQVERAPLQVYRAWKRGRYLDWTKSFPANALRNRKVRFGAYGDPAAVPYSVWRRVFEQKLESWTGYTHQWANPAFRRLRNAFMASADSAGQALMAWSQGWRTFRVRQAEEPTLAGSEVICPASEEGGKVTNCASCNLCSGQRSGARSVVINAHGPKASRFIGPRF